MYHLDLAFNPLDERRAMVCPAAFDDASAAALLALVPEPLVLTEEEALTFCANSIVIGSTILMPACPARVRAQLEEWGFGWCCSTCPSSTGGGSIRCLTNPVDVTIGRDLPAVPGGEVCLCELPLDGGSTGGSDQPEDGIRARAGGTTGADPVGPRFGPPRLAVAADTPAPPIVLTCPKRGRSPTHTADHPGRWPSRGREGLHPRGYRSPVSPASAGLDRIPPVTSWSLRPSSRGHPARRH